MTWHLKDRELEKKLIAIDPEFIDKLQRKEGYGNYGFYLDLGGYVCSGDCGVPKIQIYLVREELEEVPEYNPNGWNEFPKETPPEGVMMRVELFNLMLRKITRACAIYCNETWYAELNGEPNGTLELAGMTRVKRFRPWDED